MDPYATGASNYTPQQNKKEEAAFDEEYGKHRDTCLLIDYVEEFANLSRTEYNPTGWNNFLSIESDANTTPADIISSLTSRGGLTQFLNMSNATAGLLQPKIKLYKQYYESEDDVIGKSVEYIFDDSFDDSSIEQITAGSRVRAGGAGIKEIYWEFNGTNPAEAERVISLSLKLVFQSAAEFLGKRYNPNSGEILVDSEEGDILDASGVARYTRNYVDLILHPPQKSESFPKNTQRTNKYVPKFYRLKACVGWAVPEGNFPNLMDEPSVTNNAGIKISPNEKLKDELKAMELSIFLNLVSHQFNLRENGQIELTIDYVGSLEETINGNRANVLEVQRDLLTKDDREKIENIDAWNEYYDAADAKRNIADIKAKLDCLDLSDEGQKQQAEELENLIKFREQALKEGIEKIDNFNSQAKTIVYQQFLSRLGSKVRTFQFGEEKSKNWRKSLDSLVRPKFSDMVGLVYSTSPGLVQSRIDSAFGEALNVLEDKENKEVEKAIKETQKAAADEKEVNFLFFGDILELACEVAMPQYNKSMDSKMKIVCGPVVINHPRDGKSIKMNLADLVISYDDFQTFFFETVVRKELASFPLRAFIGEVLERLIRRNLQPRECFPRRREQRQIDVGMTNFSVRESVASELGLDNANFAFFNTRYFLDRSRFNHIKPTQVSPDGEYDILMLYMTSYAAYDLKGAESIEEDRQKGIYHYYIGAERGLIQSIEFSRSDVQGLREARQAESRNLGQIRDVYNASVKMIGNTLYIPGMKLFLNPPIGFGRPEQHASQDDPANGGSYGSLANLLGIGGYYDVINVKSTIARGNVFTTELDCVFAQHGGEQEARKALCDGFPVNTQSSRVSEQNIQELEDFDPSENKEASFSASDFKLFGFTPFD